MTNSTASNSTGVAELFHMLESNKLSDVEEIKKVFHDHFLSTKDNWLVNGLFDYYLSTDSLRAVEVLAGVREPHDKHLFDKLTETLTAKPANNGQKVRTLTLLGHVARRQPTWLYKLASHTLFKQLLYLLKMEEDIVLLMSALLLLITLLPMLPTALTPHLHEIFEVFSRLASFHYHRFLSISSANSVTFTTTTSFNFIGGNDADQLYLLHLQVGLHNLFHRLYAMYPCNFVSFLKQQYFQRDQLPIFKKIISPMIDSVRMHPLLVTMSKESEISSSRWKKMEHHDVVAECGRFSLLEKSNRDDAVPLATMRCTPISDYSCPYTPVSFTSEFPMVMETSGIQNGNQETFWSPSMVVSAHSPPPSSSLQATPISHEIKSTPSTPGAGNAIGGVNNRSRTSPPEAAVEATPETTPVKDLRQMSGRQMPVGSAAVRALGGFGNGGGLLNSSRPSTPTQVNHQSAVPLQSSVSSILASVTGGDNSSILDRKLNRIAAERQSALRAVSQDQQEETRRPVTSEQVHAILNGRAEHWHQQHSQIEDQEVSDIVSSRRSINFGPQNFTEKERQTYNDLSRRVWLKLCRNHPTPTIPTTQTCRRTKSCPGLIVASDDNKQENIARVISNSFRPVKAASTATATNTEETSTQTCGLLPYECFLLDILDQRVQAAESQSVSGPETRLSPSAMLERYIEVCARTSCCPETKSRLNSAPKQSWPSGKRNEETENGSGGVQQLPGADDGGDSSFIGSASTGCWAEMDRANQQIQLIQMQLQFERQRREVHAERNRRLLGKLRDSRALEELNSAMTNRLKLAENEIEAIKSELSISKMEARTAENKLMETIHHWQNKCKEEKQRNSTLNDRIDLLEDELKNEKKKVTEHEKQTRAAEAMLFEAAHQLKEALRAANQSEELKRVLDAVQKRYLLLGEAQARFQEKMSVPVHMARQEAAQIQRSWSEEVSGLRRQLDSQTLHLESLKSRLADLEHRDARKEVQLVEQQRILQESKEKHSAELEAVESKYKAQLEINLLLEGRILELHGRLEQAMYAANCSGSSGQLINLASSVSPKERSPPLSGSLASSSEGSLAFIHSMNDCDPAGEIANLQAIVEPVVSASTSSQIIISSSSFIHR